MLLGQKDMKNSVPFLHSPNPSPESEPKDAIMSLQASYSNPKESTMHFKGQINNKSVCALLGSGSIHNFVD
jgi:hypothetical protein